VTDPKRMQELKTAWELINHASHEEKEELFSGLINSFKEHDARLREPDNRFDSHESHAYRAMDRLRIFVCRLIGYNMGWVPEKFLEHCAYNSGRPTKYDNDTREVNCYFISQMVKRGASETQAMKLLMRLRGDSAMTSGHLRELQDTFRDYKAIGGRWEHDRPMMESAYLFIDFLKFSISDLEGDEKASQKAVDAFRLFMQELIDLMKSNFDLVAARGKGYPDDYGCVLDWIKEDYEDPLDYFYTHDSHKTVTIWDRKRGLIEYVNAIWAYTDKGTDEPLWS